MNRISGSFRDPSGFVFEQDGRIFRLLAGKGIVNYELLQSSGLYKELRSTNWILPFREADLEIDPDLWTPFLDKFENSSNTLDGQPDPGCGFKSVLTDTLSARSIKILETEKLDFVSYPYEWPFSLLKDAALLTLKIQKKALRFGMTLKDAVGYNVQFHRGRPVFIDLPSLEQYQEGKPWAPYRQFISHFLGPLLLMSRTDLRFRLDLCHFIDGIPLDYISKLLPFSSHFSPACLLHIHWHSKMIARYENSDTHEDPKKQKIVFSRKNLENLIDSLTAFTASIKPPKIKTEWDSYYNGTNYEFDSFSEKKRIVSEIVSERKPDTVIDLGANRGDFSRIAAEHCRLVLAPDIDPNAAELNYLKVRENKEEKIFPFLLDLCNPTPGLGWGNSERSAALDRISGDLVLALALIHHLCIGNNVPMRNTAEMFRKMAPALLLEFVPKEDSQTKRLLRAREDIFPNYQLEECVRIFKEFYSQCRIYPLSGSARSLLFFEDQ